MADRFEPGWICCVAGGGSGAAESGCIMFLRGLDRAVPWKDRNALKGNPLIHRNLEDML